MAHRVRLLTAFFAIYVIWGSAYLAIRLAVETIPPYFMAATRFLVAGVLLYAWARRQGAPTPALPQWRAAAIAGGLMLLGGMGSIGWAEQHIPSSLAALLIASTPIWMVLLDWLWQGGARPRPAVVVGLVIGMGGLALLLGPDRADGHSMDLIGVVVVLGAALSWTLGSLYSRGAARPASPIMTTGIQMLGGGALLLLAGLLTGEAGHLRLAAISPVSLLSLAYLIFGALTGFTAYTWLLQVTSAGRASTYAYVNPVVAVFLGWAIGGEAVTGRMLLAMAVIVVAVGLITVYSTRRAPRPRRVASTVPANVAQS
ncbi:MAG: EamA family transporter [Anaerolineae bacterium]|nr:EamA family transporter [Anaerolineae bacterium]